MPPGGLPEAERYECYDFSTPVNKNIKLKAKWTEALTVWQQFQVDMDAAANIDAFFTKYPVGTELPDTFDGDDNPWIVTGKDYTEDFGVILTKKYVIEVGKDDFQIYPVTNDNLAAASNNQRVFMADCLSRCGDDFKNSVTTGPLGVPQGKRIGFGLSNLGDVASDAWAYFDPSTACIYTADFNYGQHNLIGVFDRPINVATDKDGVPRAYYTNNIIGAGTTYDTRVVVTESGGLIALTPYPRADVGFRPYLTALKSTSAVSMAKARAAKAVTPPSDVETLSL